MEVDTLGNKTAVYMEGTKPVQQFEVNPIVNQNNPDLTITTKGTGSSTENGNAKGNEQNKGQTSEKQLKSAIADANNKLRQRQTGCEFVYHKEVDRVSIKVFDKDTKEVIWEIPTDESLQAFEKILDMAGLLVDEKR